MNFFCALNQLKDKQIKINVMYIYIKHDLRKAVTNCTVIYIYIEDTFLIHFLVVRVQFRNVLSLLKFNFNFNFFAMDCNRFLYTI